jgi:hypothetical protein
MLLSRHRSASARLTFCTIVFVAGVASARGESIAQGILRIEWDRTYGDDARWAELRAITATPDGELLVGVSERDSLDPRATTISRLLLWTVNASGERIRETELQVSSAGKPATTATIRDVVAINRDALILVDVVGGRPGIVRVDSAGKQILTRELLPAGRSVTLTDLVALGGDRFVAIGHENLNTLQVAIDAAGNVLWEKTQDRGRMDLLVDGVAAPSGTVLVANSGQFDALRSGPSDVSVARYGATGEISGEVQFPGRYGSVARSSDGALAVVFDRSSANSQDIAIKSLSPDLKEVWTTDVLKSTPSFSDFDILALPSGGFLVAGSEAGRAYLARFDAQGRQTATLRGENVGRSLDLGAQMLASRGTEVYLAASHVSVRDKKTVGQKVRIRKVAM